MELTTLLPVAAACAVAGFVLTKLRTPAGYVLGAMAVAITAKFAGWFEGTMPPLLLTAIFILIGAMIGARFNGITRQEFIRASAGGLLGTAITVALCTAVVFAISPLVDMPIGQIWLGLSPGTLAALRPYITLLPVQTPVNLNTASAEVLYACIHGLEMADAQRLVQQRQGTYFATLAAASAALGAKAGPLNPSQHSVASSFFEVIGRFRLDQTVVQERSVVQREGLAVSVLWRERGVPPSVPDASPP